jgi:hypothetical protein
MIVGERTELLCAGCVKDFQHHMSALCGSASIAPNILGTTNIDIDGFSVRIFYRGIIALYPDILHELCCARSATPRMSRPEARRRTC